MSEDDSERPIHPLEKLKKAGEEARKKRKKERVHCPECGTTVWKDTVEEAVETAEIHDDSRHGGDPTTRVNGIVPPEFSQEEKEQIRDVIETMSEVPR